MQKGKNQKASAEAEARSNHCSKAQPSYLYKAWMGGVGAYAARCGDRCLAALAYTSRRFLESAKEGGQKNKEHDNKKMVGKGE